MLVPLMAIVFISHSSADRALAEELARRLRDQGYHALFLDFDVADGIAAGREWEGELYAALRRSDGLVFLATAASVDSRWCFAELALARSMNMPVFAVRASDGARLSLIDDVQWVDLAEGEQAYARLWAGMKRARLDPAESRSWDPTRSPYPGLRAFSADDAAVFFGRSEETRQLSGLVQPTLRYGSGRWVTIVGPSGSGKSSLLCAGLLPDLAGSPERWVVVPTFVPGRRPTHQLANSLALALAARGRPCDAADLERRLADASGGSAVLMEVARQLSDAAGSTSPRVLLVIDQAEEVISRAGQHEQHAFLRLVKNATGEDSPLWVVCTLRSEYLSTAPERAGLGEVTDEALVLEPLSRNRLSEVIARPARRAGLEFDPGLVERMVEETTGGDALPLLAHTLYELAQRATADQRTHIRSTDYELLGGVVGALQRRADQLLAELTARGHGKHILPTLLKLVTLDQDGEPVRRRLTRSTLDADELQVVDAFVDARLLSSGRGGGDGADVTVEVTHEALLRRWPPLSQAIEDSRTSLRMRSELEREAADWAAGAREESYLLRGSRLAAFDEWVSRDGIHLGRLEAGFLAASKELASRELKAVQRSNRRLRQLLAAVAALLLIAVVAGGIAVNRTMEAELQADTALTRQLIAQAAALRPSQPDAALLLGVEAVERAPSGLERDARVTLLETLNRPFHVTNRHLTHADAVRTATFSPDGALLATGGNDELITLWDPATGRQRGRPLSGHTDWVQGLAFNRDGTTLASVGHDGTIRLWDPATGTPRGAPLGGHTEPVSGLAFGPDVSLLATAGEDGTVRLWDVATGQQRGEPLIRQDTELWSVAFNADGSLLATAGADGQLRLWDVATGRPSGEPWSGHDGWAISVAFHPGGSLLATSGADGVVRLWDVVSHAPVGEPMVGHVGEVSDIAFSRDGSLLASAGRDGTVRLWDGATGRPQGEPLTGHSNAVRSVEFSPDGRSLASASFDHSVRLWEVATTFPGKRSLSAHGGRVTDLAFSPHDPALLATAGADGALRLWDTNTREQRGAALVGHDGWVTSVAFSSTDDSLLASGGADGDVRLWDVDTGRPRGEPLTGHTAEVGGVVFSPDGEVLASAGRDGTLRLWDVASGRQRGDALTSPGGQVLDLVFVGDGSTIAAGNEDGSVRLWDVATREERREPSTGHTGWVLSVTYSARAGSVASGSGDGTIRLWDAETGEQRGDTLVGHPHEVNDVTISPSGTTLVSTGKDDTVRLWDVDSGRPIGEPLADDAEPVALDFDQDGSVVAVGRGDGLVELWDIRTPTLVREACETANRNMTEAEWTDLVGAAHEYRKTCPKAGG
ncbi:nSTAND1 domain-containing NTPase [Geodermatophilus sp. SYSU D00710]